MASNVKGGKQDEAAYQAYVEFVKMPKQERIKLNESLKAQGGYPTTKAEFAKKWEKNKTTLWRWEQSDNFKKDVAAEALGLISADELARILAELKLMAFDSSLSGKTRLDAMERLLKWSGVIGEFATPLQPDIEEADDEDVSNMTDAELEEFLLQSSWGDDADD